MASLLTHKHGDKAGAKYIRFSRSGQRSMIYLGNVSDRYANTVKMHVEELLSTRAGGMAPSPATAKWLTGIEPALSQKLADVGLIDQTSENATVTLDAFLTDYLATRSDLKPSTRFKLELTKRNLVDFFGADKPLKAITAGDADDFRLWLRRTTPIKPDEPQPPGFGDNTARRTCGRAKQFFEAARKRRLITESPFEDIGDCQVRANKSRDRFITADEAQKVLDACPDAQWRLLFALSRYGGLRCPSEHVGLKWSDIDWDKSRFTVHSPKTEHHEGHESRVVPIFPELRPYLEAAKAEAEPGAEYVLTIQSLRSERPNCRTHMQRIIKKAGLKPWEKLFHNLRASRQTELEAQGFPTHVVCAWLGNSPKVAREHYLRTTEADFEKATAKWEAPGEPLCAPNGSQNGCPPSMAENSLLLQIVQKALESGDFRRFNAIVGKAVQNYQAPPVGQALSAKTQGKPPKSRRQEAPEEARRLVAANIAKLPETVRAFVLAMINPAR